MGIVLASAMTPCMGDTAFAGQPPIERFDITLPVFPQHFAIEQTADGMVYVGSSDGLLVFDGERWSLLPTNGDLVRSLYADGERVYVGGYGSYGYIERDANGRAAYVDLSAERVAGAAAEGFADIWRVLRTRDGVHFVALLDVFSYDPATGAQRHVHHPGRFGAIAQCGEDTWLQFRGEGFRRWREGAWQALPHTAPLSTLVPVLVPDADGACLALGDHSGLHRLSESRIEALDLPDRLSLESVHTGIRLPGGELALSTSTGQVQVLSADLQRLYSFPVHPGFLTDISYRDGEVLVCATTAVYRFEWPSAFSTLSSMQPGRPGFIGASAGPDGILLFSDADVLRLGSDADGAAVLQPMQLSKQVTYDWLPAGRLPALLAEGHALVQFAPGRQVIDGAVYPRLLRPDRWRADRVFVGTEHGLRQLRGDREWQLLPDPDAPRDRLVSSLEQIDAQSVWIGTPDGVWRFELDGDGLLAGSRRVPVPGDDAGGISPSTADGWSPAPSTRCMLGMARPSCPIRNTPRCWRCARVRRP